MALKGVKEGDDVNKKKLYFSSFFPSLFYFSLTFDKMPHVTSLIFNSIGFVSNLYALKQINSTAFENPFALGFGGQYQVTQNNRELGK